jgi:WD40 repeat protein
MTDFSASHLDAVRALAFHPHELCIATGGDDCTVKIWRMDVTGLASSAYVFDYFRHVLLTKRVDVQRPSDDRG